MSTYGAAYLSLPLWGETVLTRPEHSGLTDDELRAEALAEAQRADIISMHESDSNIAFPRITRQQFDEYLCIGDWRE